MAKKRACYCKTRKRNFKKGNRIFCKRNSIEYPWVKDMDLLFLKDVLERL